MAASLVVNFQGFLYWFIAEIITIASSTNNHNDNIKANIDKKFKVCPYKAIIAKVTKNTNGAASQATEASFI